jgi:hypothetical protein
VSPYRAGVLRGNAVDGQTIELMRQTDGKVANVDHLLNLTESFRDNLADFDRDETPECLFVGA